MKFLVWPGIAAKIINPESAMSLFFLRASLLIAITMGVIQMALGTPPVPAPDLFTEIYMGTYSFQKNAPPKRSLRHRKSDASLLAYAVRHGNKKLAADILTNEPAELKHQDKVGNNAMYEMVRKSDFDTLKKAFEVAPKDAIQSLNSENQAGWSATMLTGYKKLDLIRLKSIVGEVMDLEQVEAQVGLGRDYRRIVDSIYAKDHVLIKDLLSERPELANQATPNGLSLISIAGVKPDLTSVRILLENGVRPEGTAKMTLGPVAWALRYNANDVLNELRTRAKLTRSSRVWGEGVFEPPQETTVASLLKEYDAEHKWNVK